MQDCKQIPVLWAMYRVYVRQIDPKKRTVWVRGRGDTGKSAISDWLNKIFINSVFTNSDSKYTKSEQRREF